MRSENAKQAIEQATAEEVSTQPKKQKPQLLEPSERATLACKLTFGENAEIPETHNSIKTPEQSDWFIRSYFGKLFAQKNDNPLTEKFGNLENLLKWFDETYPLKEVKTNE